MSKPIKHEVYNRITGERKSYKTLSRALKAMDRQDNAYGAYITTRKAIYE